MKNLFNPQDWSDVTNHLMLGEILVESGKLNLIQLGMALDIQRFSDMKIGEIIKEMNIIKEEDLRQALILQKEIDKRG